MFDLSVNCPFHWSVPDVLMPGECRALIAKIEAADPKPAPITTHSGPVFNENIRNNTRVIFDDPALAAELFRRVEKDVPAQLDQWRIAGANERLRCYRYTVGQRFAPHADGAFYRSEDERSFFTFMIYLNDGFEGGDTDFLELRERVTPRAGLALFFQHPLIHEGCEVTAGTKYVLRSDLMYRRG